MERDRAVEYVVVFPCDGEGCTNDSDLIVRRVPEDDRPSLHLCQDCLWKGAVMPCG